MPAYWVARSRIIDAAEYKKYTDRVPAIIAKHGGKVLARGGRFQIMEGPDKFHRFVVIEFPTLEQGVACFTSAEYDEAAAFRARQPASPVPVARIWFERVREAVVEATGSAVGEAKRKDFEWRDAFCHKPTPETEVEDGTPVGRG